MSNHSDLAAIHHTLQGMERQIKKNSGQLNWILIIVVTSLVISLISVLVAAAK